MSAKHVINYVDFQGNQIASHEVTPNDNGMINLEEFTPVGYHILTDSEVKAGDLPENQYDVLTVPNVKSFNADDDAVKESLKKMVIRTVKIIMPNGRERVIKQEVRFIRNANAFGDGQVEYGDWHVIGSKGFNKVYIPEHKGYKVIGKVDKVDDVKVTDEDSVVTVKYVKEQKRRSST